MENNWWALYLTAISNKSVDKALGALGIRPQREVRKNNINLSESDVLVLEYLKEQNTWDQLGKMCGTRGDLLRTKVRDYKKKTTKELCRATSAIAFENNLISL